MDAATKNIGVLPVYISRVYMSNKASLLWSTHSTHKKDLVSY